MPLKDIEAFVLRSAPIGEADRVVTFLTRSEGKIRCVAKGARRSRRRFGANLELLSRVRLRYFEKEGADLGRVESAELLESFYALQEDPERGAVLACLAEIADAFAREQQEDEAFYRLLHALLRALRDGLSLDWAERYFELWTLRLHGVLPSPRECARCASALAERGGTYDRREGGVLCSRCAGTSRSKGVLLPPGSLRAAETILREAPQALIGRPTERSALAPLASMAAAIFFDLTEKTFKSTRVLRALRGGT